MDSENKKNWIQIMGKYIPLAVISASIILIINFFTPVIFLEMPLNAFGASINPSQDASYLRLVGGIKIGGSDVIPALPFIIVMLILPVIILILCVLLIKNNNFKNYKNNKIIFIVLFIISCSFLAAHIALYAISGYYISLVSQEGGYGYAISSILKWGPTFFGVVDFICIIFILFILVCTIWGDKLGINEKFNNIIIDGKKKKDTDGDDRKRKQYISSTKLPILIAVDTSANIGSNVISEISNNISNMVSLLAGDMNAANKLDLEIIEFNNGPVVTKRFAENLGSYGNRCFNGGQFSYMGAGLSYAADEVESKLREYDAQGTEYYKPWMFIISAGTTNDEVTTAKQKLSSLEIQRGMNIYPVGLNISNMDSLKYFTNKNTALRITGYSTYSIFSWIKDCISLICSTQKGAKIKMPPLPPNVIIM